MPPPPDPTDKPKSEPTPSLHLPLRSVLDPKPEALPPIARVDAPTRGPDPLPTAGTEQRPSTWLTDEDLTPEERALRQVARRRRWLWLAGVALIFGLVIVYARPMGRSITGWQARRLARSAEQLLTGKNWQAAYPLLSNAVKLSQNDPLVNRAMADFQSRAGSTEAIGWWKRVCELEPGEPVPLLRLTHAYLKEHETELAVRTLAKVPAVARQSAAYYEAAAAVAVAQGDFSAAEEPVKKWRALEPRSEHAQLNGAIVRIRSADPGPSGAAREELRSLQSSPTVGRRATRALVTDSLQRADYPTAIALVRPLVEAAEGEFEDRLLELDVLAQAQDPTWTTRVHAAQAAAGEDPEKIVALARSLSAQRRFSEAYGWLRSLRDTLRSQPPVATAVAEAILSIRDWNGLEKALRGQQWGATEFLRLAFLARAAREQNRSEAAQSWWKRSLEQASDQLKRAALLRLVSSWNWAVEAEEVLWTMRVANPSDPAPLDALERSFAAAGNTRGLLRVARERLSGDPQSSRARNDLTATSLLLRDNLPEAHAAADALGALHPNDAIIQATLAHSLLLRARPAEALAVLRRLPESALRRPAIAGYYGVVLCATGQRELAEAYFGFAERSASLLPEEQEMMAGACQSAGNR